MVSCYCLGALAGCILTVFIGDILGRRKMMWLAMCFVLVGATLQTSSFTVPHLIIGRVITGKCQRSLDTHERSKLANTCKAWGRVLTAQLSLCINPSFAGRKNEVSLAKNEIK